MKELKEYYEGKTILVTGGAGSIGSEIVRKVLRYKPEVVRVLDNNETALFDLQHELRAHEENLRMFVGDVRDKERCKRTVEDIDIVFHAAALKHVPLCEYNPFEAVKTNVIGTQNMIEVAMDEKVEKFITISTDKVVNPLNVLGATKLLAERLTISANFYKGKRKTVFASVRFGNVLGSRGSIVPLFEKQIKSGGPLTITDPRMTRFIMSISEAVTLILRASCMAEGGEVFILEMPAVRIKDLAEVMIEELAPKYGYDPRDIKLETSGIRPGEKLHEELLTEHEVTRTYDKDGILVMTPQLTAQKRRPSSKKERKLKHTSCDAQLLTKSEIKKLLEEATIEERS
jgi:FlaA1/EpsC-like NDP-sugar epimerase